VDDPHTCREHTTSVKALPLRYKRAGLAPSDTQTNKL
jgi:hypothetical protein